MKRGRAIHLVLDRIAVLMTAFAAVWSVGCGKSESDPQSPTTITSPGEMEPKRPDGPVPALVGGPRATFFMDETKARGIEFKHSSGATGQHHMPEQLGGGVALFDADGDGDLDILFINGGPLPGFDKKPENELYLNDATGRFARVADAGGMACGTDYGVGCAVVDYDLDGDLDVFISNWGQDRLFANDGKAHFTEVTREAGITSKLWGASAAVGDVDANGWPDIYLTNYLEFDITKSEPCYQREHRIYCGPQPYPGQVDVLYMNENGVFKDQTKERVSPSPDGKGLGVVMADFEHDGDLDIYVANDQTPNFLLQNDGTGHFKDIANFVGVAVSRDAIPEAGMGVAWTDYDNDLLEDIFVTNFEDQTNSVYKNDGDGFFTECSFQAGIGYESRPLLGWGIGVFDFDLDGWKDAFYVNGHVYENAAKLRDTSSWDMRPCMHFNRANGTFERADKSGIDILNKTWPARAAAFGDIDNDGDLDILFTCVDGPPVLLVNSGATGNFLMIETRHPRGGAPFSGARIEVTVAGKKQMATIQSGASFAAASDHRAHFGWRSDDDVEEVVVHWPGGKKETFGPVPRNRLLSITPGKAAVVKSLAGGKEIATLTPR